MFKIVLNSVQHFFLFIFEHLWRVLNHGRLAQLINEFEIIGIVILLLTFTFQMLAHTGIKVLGSSKTTNILQELFVELG